MDTFRFQHPSDLISRLFILEYMRDLGPDTLYEKANKHQREKMFYKFIDDENEGKEAVDLNWEFCLFGATLYELEGFASLFLEEIEEIVKKREVIMKKLAQTKIEENIAAPVDINVMDLAATEIKKNTQGGLQLS